MSDVTDDWKLVPSATSNGKYYDAVRTSTETIKYLGNGRTELSAWVELRDILEARRDEQ